MKKIQGITLIALVITIVILLILASVSIAMLTGENGIIQKAEQAKLENKRASIKEMIDLTILEEKTMNPLGDDKEILGYAKNKLENDNYKELKKYGENIDIRDVSSTQKESYFYVIVDKDVYRATINGTTYESTQSDNIILQDGEILFTYTPSTPTREKVKVKIEENTDKISEGVIKYKLENDSDWKSYTNEIEVDKNCNIYAKLEGINGQSTVATGTVDNIDTLPPNKFTPTATSTNSSINITGSTTDQEKTSTSACSGVSKYYFSKDNGSTWYPEQGQESTSYTFENLSSGTTYNLKMKAVDSAGNEITTDTLSVTTKNTYTISYNANGGSGAPSSQTKIQGTNITLSTEVPTRYGYEFKGWGTSSSSTTVSYNPGSKYSQDKSITLYAIWEQTIIEFTNGTSKYVEAIYHGSRDTNYETTAYPVPAGSEIQVSMRDTDVYDGAYTACVRVGNEYYYITNSSPSQSINVTTTEECVLIVSVNMACDSNSPAHAVGTISVDYIKNTATGKQYILEQRQ